MGGLKSAMRRVEREETEREGSEDEKKRKREMRGGYE